MTTMDQTEERMRAGMRVRYEVIGTIHRNPPVPIKLPSASQFAAKYSLSVKTVTLELKRLRDEGWITGQKGVGTFTNPAKINGLPDPLNFKIVGILNRDGKATFYDYNHWAFQMYAGLAIAPDIGYPRPLTLSLQTPENMYEELRMLNLDGIVWSFPPEEMMPFMHKLQSEGVKIVSQFRKAEGIPYVGVDYVQEGRDIAEILLRENRRRVIWCTFNRTDIVDGAEEVFAARGIGTDDFLVCRDMAECEQKLIELLEKRSLPDAIYIHSIQLHKIKALFEKYGIDIYADDSCILIAGWSIVRNIPDFTGIIRKYPYEAIGNAAAELLRQSFASTSMPTDRIFHMEVKRIRRS